MAIDQTDPSMQNAPGEPTPTQGVPTETTPGQIPSAESAAVQTPEPQPAQTQPATPGQPVSPEPPVQPMTPLVQPTQAYAQAPSNAPDQPINTGSYAASPAAAANEPSPTPALVLGILAIVFACIPIVGIILGILAIVQAGKYFQAGGTQGTAKGGKICGIIGIILSGIMIIVTSAMIVFGLAILDDLDVDASYTSSSSNNTDSTYATIEDRFEDELYDVVDPELDKIVSGDPEMVAAIAAIMEESINSEMLSEHITLADLQVDPNELAKAMIVGFSYEHDFTNIDGSEGEAWYEITCKDSVAIAFQLNTKIDEIVDGSTQYSSTSEVYAAIGQALMDAVAETEEMNTSYADYDLTKSGDKWVLDPDSWTEELEYLFAI